MNTIQKETESRLLNFENNISDLRVSLSEMRGDIKTGFASMGGEIKRLDDRLDMLPSAKEIIGWTVGLLSVFIALLSFGWGLFFYYQSVGSSYGKEEKKPSIYNYYYQSPSPEVPSAAPSQSPPQGRK